jgi:uncharacterized membrane protein YkvA (DUF1232 family)
MGKGIIGYIRRKSTIVPGNKSLGGPRETAGLLSETVRQLRLVWRLLLDRRVPIWPKLIIPGTIAYLLSPIDLLSDPILGVGQLDDIAVILIGLKLFVELCPRDLVQEHLDDLSSVVRGSYRVVAEDGEQQESSGAEALESEEGKSRLELREGSTEEESAE